MVSQTMNDFNNQVISSINSASKTADTNSQCQPTAECLTVVSDDAREVCGLNSETMNPPCSSSMADLESVFSIIIVSFNTRELTLQCLDSLQEHAPVAQVIVVDNASNDGSADAIRDSYPGVQLVELSQNIGFGRANTLGMERACHEAVVLLNSDTVINDDALRRCVCELWNNPKLGAVTPLLEGTDGQQQNARHPFPDIKKTILRSLRQESQAAESDDFWIPGTCMVLRRSAVEAAGGLFSPELFIYWEDADLCSRLKANGYELAVVQDAKITHYGGASGGGPNCTAKSGLHEWYTFGRHFWFNKHRPLHEGIVLWVLEFVDAFRCMGRAIIRPTQRRQFGYGIVLLKTLIRRIFQLEPTFAAPKMHGRRDNELIVGNQTENTRSTSNAQVGIVVIGRNEGQRLQTCLASVANELDFVVYVDSGSTDGSQQLAKSMGADVVSLDMQTPFTAARARNTGLQRLLAIAPDVQFVQFVDADCELRPQWIGKATKAILADKECAIVCGMLQERHPEASIYNTLCQLEWRRPVGVAASSGGIFLGRIDALTAAGGFNESLIAGEEPELCFRLRNQNWKIQTIDAPMAIHDADMTNFGQWWKRSVRSGYAYAQGYHLHGATPERFQKSRLRSIAFWAFGMPVAAVAAIVPTYGASLLLALVAYGLQYVRVKAHRQTLGESFSDASLYARFVLIGKFAQAIGIVRFYWSRLNRQGAQIIEYKTALAEVTQ